MWYGVIAIMLTISMVVGFRLTMIMDKRLSDDEEAESNN
jgi:hypothetical protein